MAFWNRYATRGPAMVPETEPARAEVKSVSYDSTFAPILAEYGTGFPGGTGATYRRHPAVRTVVDFLARNVGTLRLKTYGRVGNDDRIELDGHPLAELLRRPNPDTTQSRLLRDTVADIFLEDVAYWLKVRGSGGRVQRVYRLPVSRVARSTVGGEVEYRNTVTNQVLRRDDLVIFPGYSPEGNPWGVTPRETLRRLLNESANSEQHRASFWKNAARREGVIQRPIEAPPWDDDAIVRFREGWQAAHSGSTNAGKTVVLEDGMTWAADSFSPKEAEYIEGRRLMFQEVCRFHGVAPQLFGVDGELTQEHRRQLYADTFGPLCVFLQDEVDLQLLPETDTTPATAGRVYTEFNLRAKLKASFEEQAAVLVTTTGVPFTTVNETRAFLNLPKLDDPVFDLPVQPLNVMYGGQPAPTVPTADPSTPASEMAGTPNTRSARAETKADVPDAVQRRRSNAADEHTDAFVRYFRKQERAYLAWSDRKSKGSKADWDTSRWDKDLTGVLFGLAVPLAADAGTRAAKQVQGTFDVDETTAFLAETTRRSAVNINAETMKQLDGKDPEGLLHVFAVAKGSRAVQLGMSQATGIINFARTDAARQSENADGRERTKTWIVTSKRSRHPHLDGETVKANESFSNGLLWPGDAAGSVDELAGCKCLLVLNS